MRFDLEAAWALYQELLAPVQGAWEKADTLLVVMGVRLDDAVYFEAALVIGLLGFVGTVAMARYLLRGNIID